MRIISILLAIISMFVYPLPCNSSLTEEDLSFGEFSLNMALEDAVPLFPSSPISETETDDGYITTKTLTFDSLEIMFLSEEGRPFTLYYITTTGSALVTPRGLRVGDSAKELFSLYGVPSTAMDGVWIYGYGEFQNFHVTIKKGIVQQIRLNSVL